MKKDSPVNTLGKILEQHFIKDLGMAQKLLKRCSPSLVIREMQMLSPRKADTRCRSEDGFVTR